MKVLGIVSSPRRGGNSELAVKEMMMQLPASWEKEMIRLNELDIKNCTACYSCIPAEKQCHLKDDLNFYVNKVREADKIIMAGPCYCFGGHTTFKVAADRMLSVSGNFEEFWEKECVLAGFYGHDGWDGLLREDMLIAAKQFNLKVVDSDFMYATLPGDSVKGENLERVRILAKALEAGTRQTTPSEGDLACSRCTSHAIRLHADGTCRCALCGATGKVTLNDGKMSIEMFDEPLFHFTKPERASHVDYLDEKKKLFLATRKEIQALQAKYDELDIWVRPE